MALKLDHKIKSCMAKPGVPGPANKATAYCYQPIPDGTNAASLTIEINGNFVARSKDRPVFLYRAGDRPGEWELLTDVAESWFIDNFDFTD